MKIIFLDIDGVLNSRLYDLKRGENDGNIDQSRLVLLKQLVDKTGAKIVLTTSWRRHWDPSGKNTDEIGKELEATFLQCGLQLYDRTDEIDGVRAKEVEEWLSAHTDVESFVIFDDIKFGWGRLDENAVKTDYRIGLGIEEKHIEKALEILTRG